MISKPQDENRTVSTDPGIGSGHAESSDGDSSTYGQIKTFESFFEGTSPVELIDVNLRLTAAKVTKEILIKKWWSLASGPVPCVFPKLI